MFVSSRRCSELFFIIEYGLHTFKLQLDPEFRGHRQVYQSWDCKCHPRQSGFVLISIYSFLQDHSKESAKGMSKIIQEIVNSYL